MKRCIIFIAIATLIGCGPYDQTPASPPIEINISGKWTGIWTSGDKTGGITLSLIQNESEVIGTATVQGSSCYSSMVVVGLVSGENVELTFSTVNIKLTFKANDVNEYDMNGEYIVTEGSCKGERGIFNLVKGG